MTRLERLQNLRDLLTERATSGGVPDTVLPQIVAQLRATLADIEAVEKAQPQTKGTVLDELNAKRAEREAKSASRPARSSKRR